MYGLRYSPTSVGMISMAKDPEKKKTRASKAKKIVLLVVLFLALAVVGTFAGVYYTYAQNYSERFFDGTVINGIDCSGLTVDEVESQLRAAAEDYAVTVKFRDGTTDTLDHTDLGYEYVSDGSVAALLTRQNPYEWVKRWFDKELVASDRHEVSVDTTYDEVKIRKSLYDLAPMLDENMEAPTDAYVSFTDGSFQVNPETEGSTIDRAKVLRAVLDAVAAHEDEVDVTKIPDVYRTPAVRADDPALNEKAAQLNSYISSSVTLHMPAGDQVLDGSTLINWLAVDEAGNYSFDEKLWNEKLGAYVDEMAKVISDFGTSFTFQGTGIGEVTVSEGDYYWELDVEAEKAQLAADLASAEPVARYPKFANEGFTYENGGLGYKYIEIDLSRQHLWFYIDGNVFFDTDIVSGNMTTKYWTPPGIFKVKLIKKDAILRGERLPNGSYEYETPVKYWMPFNYDIGMHDASWRGSFGGDIYIWDGSHGCVNLPLASAETIFNNIDYNTPVICYYSQYYEFRG